MRIESDAIGELPIPADALYGIHAARARENFPDHTAFFMEWFRSVGVVKHSCYLAYRRFKETALENNLTATFRWIDNDIISALIQSAIEVSEGLHFEHFIVPAVQGGAGTSINMNVNEIIANRALLLLGKKPGNYAFLDPIEHANVFQSTNDVIPTALKVAGMKLLNELETVISQLRQSVENIEVNYRNHLRIAYTQMQEAVPSSFGRLFGTYSDALSRDWWRVSKCFERIKTVNLGGGAVGTGIAVPQFFIMQVVSELQHLTNLPVTRAENLQDATANNDSFVEVHGILKAHAVNLEKIANDLRMLSSELGHKDIYIPKKQTGSSIMPGKINPVIPEFIISAAHKVYTNDHLITDMAAMGCLDLNAYLPLIGHALINSLKLLVAAGKSMHCHLLDGLSVHGEVALNRLLHSPSLTTALVPYLGYNAAALLATEMKENNSGIFEANNKLKLIGDDLLRKILEPSSLLRLGYSLNDTTND